MLSAVDQDGDRAVVSQVDLHLGLENTGFYPHTCTPEPVYKIGVEQVGLFGFGSVGIGRAPSSPDVSIKRELGNHEDSAVIVDEGEIHLSIVVRENTEIDDLVGQVIGVACRIVITYGEEDCEAGFDFADDPAIDLDPGFGDSLYYGSH